MKKLTYKNNRGHTPRSMTEGFSTLEMLIAMTILVMVLSAVIFVTFGNQSLFIDSETNSEALNKAKELLEQEQALARKDFKLVNPVATVTDDIYQKTISVTNTDFFTKRVTSSVTWLGDHKKPQSINLTALVTNFSNAVGGDTCYSVLAGDWTKPKIINPSKTSLATIVGDSTGSYPITDLDVYQNKLYVTVNNSTGVNAGANNPTVAGGTSGGGSVSWSNPNNIKLSDNIRATALLVSGSTTRYMKATNFGFNIPDWATITGIKVEVERSIAGTTNGGVKDSEVKIIKADGSISVNNKADTSTSWPVVASESIATYNPSDLWGEKWSPADINDVDFGVAISAGGTSTRTAQIDNIKITITYIRQFYSIDISNPTNPVFVTELGSNSAVKTGFKAVAVATNSTNSNAYIATNTSTGQFQILDLNTTPASVLSTMKLALSPGVGNSIFFKDGYVFLGLTHNGTGPEFNIIDVHDPINPALVGSASIGNDVNAIYVKDSYAYVASPNTNDLLVFDVGVSKFSSSMSPVGSFSGTGGLHGKSIYVVGDTAYLGRTFGTNELYALDTSSLSSITDLGHVDTGTSNDTSLNSLIIRDYLAFFLNTAGQFQVWEIDDPASMTRYDSAPLSNFPSAGNNTPLDCEANNFYGAYTDSSNKGFITVITSS